MLRWACHAANADDEALHTLSIQVFTEDDERLFNEMVMLQSGESYRSPPPVIEGRGRYRVTVTVDGTVTKIRETV